MSRHEGYADKRAAILDATLRVLVREGYAALTMDGVVREAGISKGTLYHYWGSKEVLVEAALHTAGVELAEHHVAGAREAGPRGPAARLDTLLNVARPWTGPRSGAAGDLGRILLATPGFEHLQVRTHAGVVDALTAEMTPILADGAASGVFRLADPSRTAELLVTLALAARARMVRVDDADPTARAVVAAAWSDAFLTTAERAVGLPASTLARHDVTTISRSWS